MDCSLPGFSVHGIFQARVLQWVAISFSRGSSRPRDWTLGSSIADRRFTIWATREAGAYQKMDFSGPRLLHLPIHRKITKFINLRSSFLSLINDNLLLFQFYLFTPIHTFCPFIVQEVLGYHSLLQWIMFCQLSPMTHPSWVALHTWPIASWHHQCNGHELG